MALWYLALEAYSILLINVSAQNDLSFSRGGLYIYSDMAIESCINNLAVAFMTIARVLLPHEKKNSDTLHWSTFARDIADP